MRHFTSGVTVAVLEADDRPGGRMRPIHGQRRQISLLSPRPCPFSPDRRFSIAGFAPDGRDIEAGAAYIHGDDNILYRHAQLQGWQLCPRVFPKWVHLPPHQSPGAKHASAPALSPPTSLIFTNMAALHHERVISAGVWPV